MITAYIKAHGGWIIPVVAWAVAAATAVAGTLSVPVPIIGQAAICGLLPILLVPAVARSCFDAMGSVATLPGRPMLGWDLLWISALILPVLLAAQASSSIDATSAFALVTAGTVLISGWASLTTAGSVGVVVAFGLFLRIGPAMRNEAGFWGDWWRGTLPMQVPIVLSMLVLCTVVGLRTRGRHSHGLM